MVDLSLPRVLILAIVRILLMYDIQSVESNETEYANVIKPIRNDGHITTSNNNTEFPREGENMGQTGQKKEDNGSVPGCLPEYNNLNNRL